MCRPLITETHVNINHDLEMRGNGTECLRWPLLKVLAVDKFEVRQFS